MNHVRSWESDDPPKSTIKLTRATPCSCTHMSFNSNGDNEDKPCNSWGTLFSEIPMWGNVVFFTSRKNHLHLKFMNDCVCLPKEWDH